MTEAEARARRLSRFEGSPCWIGY